MLSYQENKEWLHKLMDLLEAHFGPDVEFVLHDLTLDYEHTIVDIRNGHITGREIGGTGDILGLEYIRNASEDNGTYYNFIEYTKEVQEAWEAAMPINMGQILSIPFVLLGAYCMAGGKLCKKLAEKR